MPLKSIFVGILFLFVFGVVSASEISSRGWPAPPHRPSYRYQGLGSAYESSGRNGRAALSPLWFTVQNNAIGPVFYPTLDRPQIEGIEILITDGKSLFLDQKHDALTHVGYEESAGSSPHQMGLVIQGESKLGLYKFEEKLVSDPNSSTLRIHLSLNFFAQGLKVFVLFKPTLNGGQESLGLATPEGLVANDLASTEPLYAALVSSRPWVNPSARTGKSLNRILESPGAQAGPGKVWLLGGLTSQDGQHVEADLALAFGKSLSEALILGRLSAQTPFQKIAKEYEASWIKYIDRIKGPRPNLHPALQRILTESPEMIRSAILLKMHEDKNHPGALAPFLGAPALSPKEIYHQAMGHLAAGDEATATNALRYFEKIQNPNGSFSSKYSVSGKVLAFPRQYDQTAYPILLYKQLEFRGLAPDSWKSVRMVEKAAEFISTHGPLTPEGPDGGKGGYVPGALAAMTAAFQMSGVSQEKSAQWEGSLEKWLLAADGTYRDSSGNLSWGALDLVRYGLRSSKDPRMVATLKACLDSASGLTLDSDFHLRKGLEERVDSGLKTWPHLSGELGNYFLSLGNSEATEQARTILEHLFDSMTRTQLLPQFLVTSKTSATAVGRFLIDPEAACPFMPAHAETLILYRSLQEGTPFDRPRQH